jgi:predicted metalloprotease
MPQLYAADRGPVRHLLVLLAALALVPSAQGGSIDRVTASIARELNTYWAEEGAAIGKRYAPLPHLYLYKSFARTRCGVAPPGNAVYCPTEHAIYLNRALLARAASISTFAAATIVAHEWGHYVQHRFGWLGWAVRRRYYMGVELQADCYAGMFLHYARDAALLEERDVQAAEQLMVSVGDTRALSPSMPGAHGTSEQRLHWFETGLDSGDLTTCDAIYKTLYP